jgi:hypothetical protein
MQRLIISIIVIGILVCDCDRDSKSDCGNTLCTLEFKGIAILIKHTTDSTAVLLTSYKVLRVSDNKDITINHDSTFGKFGYYTLVDDSEKAMLKNINVEIEFQGYIENSLVIKEQFVVTADCCHVSLLSGETEVYI